MMLPFCCICGQIFDTKDYFALLNEKEEMIWVHFQLNTKAQTLAICWPGKHKDNIQTDIAKSTILDSLIESWPL